MLEQVAFDRMGRLVPAVVQDADTARVLMLGYMNRAALDKSFELGRVTFYSRSKRRLWTKGETSGNHLELVSVQPDCDADALLVLARPAGPTCHLGRVSCFDAPGTAATILGELDRTIAARRDADPERSYTARLLRDGTDGVARKLGEEAVETILAAASESDERLAEEAADLLYHLLVLLRSRGLDLARVGDVLDRRR